MKDNELAERIFRLNKRIRELEKERDELIEKFYEGVVSE